MGRVAKSKLASSSGFRTGVGCPSGFIKFSFFSVLHISSTNFTMSMFSGLANHISGFVASKTGGGAEQPPVDPNDPNAQMDPNYVQNGAEGEVPPEGQAPGGMMGMAQGFLGKAMAAKQGLQEKASGFQPPNLGNVGGGMLGNITSMIPGQNVKKRCRIPIWLSRWTPTPKATFKIRTPWSIRPRVNTTIKRRTNSKLLGRGHRATDDAAILQLYAEQLYLFNCNAILTSRLKYNILKLLKLTAKKNL